MAFQKAKEDRAGNSGDYWRIDSIYIERKSGKMEVRINQYKSKADYDAGKRSMDGVETVVVDIPSGPIVGLVAAAYSGAKVIRTSNQQDGDTPYFEDAVEV